MKGRRWLSALTVLLSVLPVASRAGAKETTIDEFERSTVEPWTFSNGPEFPGATGSLAIGAGLTGNGAHLAYDLGGGGHYVAASLTLPTPVTAKAVGFSLQAPPGIRCRLRVVDSGGQTLQYDVNRPLYAAEGRWFHEVVDVDAPSSHFGGANDGVVHQPIQKIAIVAGDPVEPGAVGAIDFDDVVVIDALSASVDPRRHEDISGPGVQSLGSRLGVNIHFTNDDPVLDQAVSAGFSFVRMDLGWSGVERTKGTYDFSAVDTLVAALAKRKLGLLLILDYMNPLYPGADASNFGSVTVPAFASMAKAVAMHLAGKDVRFEIWNEPNLDGFWPPKADPVAYAALAKAAIAAVHAGNPAAIVSTAGISAFDFPFLRAYLNSGGGDGADAIGVHPYRQTGAESASDDLLLMRAIVRAKFPSEPPVWSTEWGYSSTWYGDGHSPANRTTQAVRAVRELLTAWALDFPVAVYYDLRDDGTDPANGEHNFGLLANDGSPKPAYTAVKTLTGFAQGRTMAGYYDVAPSSLHALRLQGRGSASAVVWSDAPGASVTLTVPPRTTAIGLLGAPVTATPSGGNLAVTVREADGPVYLSTAEAPIVDGGATGTNDASSDGGTTGAGGSASGAGRTGNGGGANGGTMNGGSSGATVAGASGGAAASGGASGGASGAAVDASTTGDSTSQRASDSSSCGCALPAPSRPRAAWVALAALALSALRRRTARRLTRGESDVAR